MTTKTNIESANEFATVYDEYILNCQWFGTDILFGLLYEFLKPNQKILDIGIGTGLSSILFKKYGLDIYGIDGSSKMIGICREKGVTEKLKQVDFNTNQVWFENVIFDHIISHAVFHLIGDLESVFAKASLTIIKNGYFGFTYERILDEDNVYNETSTLGVFENINSDSGIKSYQHTEKYIFNLLELNGFIVEKKTEFLAFFDSNSNIKKYFNIVIAKKS